jgi:hypothetical protein
MGISRSGASLGQSSLRPPSQSVTGRGDTRVLSQLCGMLRSGGLQIKDSLGKKVCETPISTEKAGNSVICLSSQRRQEV